jgi:23S rRNA-/tRNA-specific pseudouridylate synthase
MPRTGRTHQIRVHLADLGFPIAGDRVYGGRGASRLEKECGSNPFSRQALHAEKLVIRHPRTNEVMEFHAPLPDDMKLWLTQLRKERFK